ncbi:rhodanese-like domain-containing protein [Hydrogenophaga sp. 5NK40-0174]|uniref:rhodanese-like domain-containing protein n=1 Tax=Hydrogenophaga sp. 5NK40-0174 TaxID=3127649 RepID=UPI00333F7B20
MSFIVENWYLILLAVVSGGLLMWPVISGNGGGSSVNATETVMLMNRDKAVVVDVCEADEFAQGHISGARHAPLNDLESKLPSVVKNKATPLVMVCASGARSNRAVAVAKKLGYEKVYSLAGGMGAWRKENLPVEKA